MSATTEAIERAVAPFVASRDLVLYDVEWSGSGRARILRVAVTEADGRGPDIDRLSELSRELDPVVDAIVDGAFSLEVSSPGLERPLRRAEHFAAAVGERLTLKFRHDGSITRLAGTLIAFGGDESVIEVAADDGTTRTIAIDAVTSAHTQFEWGPAPRPGKGSKPGTAKHRAAEHSA